MKAEGGKNKKTVKYFFQIFVVTLCGIGGILMGCGATLFAFITGFSQGAQDAGNTLPSNFSHYGGYVQILGILIAVLGLIIYLVGYLLFKHFFEYKGE